GRGGLARRARRGERVPGPAEHPEREPGQAASCPVLQVAVVDERGDELLDEPVGVLLLAFPPPVPAERGRALQPDQPPVDRVAALLEVRVERLGRRLPGVGRGGRGGDPRQRPRFLAGQHRLEQRLLAREVVIHGSAGHLAGGRDVLQRRAAVPARGELDRRLVQQRGPRSLGVQLATALDLRHTPSIVTYTQYVTSG